MSKKKPAPAPKSPAFQNSSVFNGDDLVSQTYQDPTYGIVTKYNSSPEQQAAKAAAQARINALLPTLGQSSPEMSAQYDQMANAYSDNAKASFDRIYDPSLRNLREDAGARFGTTQATPYYDQLTSLEKNVKAPAYAQIANDATQQKQNLYNNAQSQKLQELQSLGYVLSGDQQNFLNGLSSSQTNSNNGNSFNLTNYQNALQNYQFNQSRGSQAQGLGLQALGLGLSSL